MGDLPEVGAFKLFQFYDRKTDSNNSRITPYLICPSCYHSGITLLESTRLHFSKKAILKGANSLNTSLIFKGNKFVTERLIKYVESQGRKLPVDFVRYRNGGINADICLFCGDVPADFPVEQYHSEHLHTDSGCYACYSCNQAIENQVASLMRNDIFAGANIDSISRIQKFVRTGEFDDSVELHYQHLIKDRDDDPDYIGYEGIYTHNCYFCKSITPDVKLLQVPVTASSSFTGGHVRVCSNCNSKMSRFRAEDSYALDPLRIWEDDVCDACGADYLISIHEHRQREADGSIGKHMCPVCTHVRAFRGEKDSIFSVKAKDGTRYDMKRCSYCSGSVLFDLTLSRRILTKNFVSDEATIICSSCKYKNKSPIFVERLPATNRINRYYRFKDKFIALVGESNPDTLIDTVELKCKTAEEAPVLLARIRNGKT